MCNMRKIGQDTLLCLSDVLPDGPVAEVSDFEVRFLGNRTSLGRVEIFHSGKWNGLCMRETDPSVVTVICRSLGYSAGLVLGLNRRESFGSGFSEVWVEKITCSGSESSVKDCQRIQWMKEACHSSQQLAVGCYNSTFHYNNVCMYVCTYVVPFVCMSVCTI